MQTTNSTGPLRRTEAGLVCPCATGTALITRDVMVLYTVLRCLCLVDGNVWEISEKP